MHIRLGIQPGRRVLQERRHIRLGVVDVVHAELGQVDGTVPTDGVGLLDVGGQVAEGVRGGVPVEVDEVDGAAGAVAEEVGEVGEGGGGPAVGDAGGAEEGAAGEGLHVGLVGGDGGGDAHAGGLAVVAGVWFVEAEERVATVGLDRVLCVCGPDGGERGGVVVE